MLVIVLSYMSFIMVRYFIPSSLRLFIINAEFCQKFLCIFSNEPKVFILQFIN